MEHSNIHDRHGDHAKRTEKEVHADHMTHMDHNAPMSQPGHDHHAADDRGF